MAESVKEESVYEVAERELWEALEDHLDELPPEVAYQWGMLQGVKAVFEDMGDEFEEGEETEEDKTE